MRRADDPGDWLSAGAAYTLRSPISVCLWMKPLLRVEGARLLEDGVGDRDLPMSWGSGGVPCASTEPGPSPSLSPTATAPRNAVQMRRRSGERAERPQENRRALLSGRVATLRLLQYRALVRDAEDLTDGGASSGTQARQ